MASRSTSTASAPTLMTSHVMMSSKTRTTRSLMPAASASRTSGCRAASGDIAVACGPVAQLPAR
jgi:hypothetical protein